MSVHDMTDCNDSQFKIIQNWSTKLNFKNYLKASQGLSKLFESEIVSKDGPNLGTTFWTQNDPNLCTKNDQKK